MEHLLSLEKNNKIEIYRGNWTLLQKERNINNKDLYLEILKQLRDSLSKEVVVQREKSNDEIILKKSYKNEDREAVENIIENFETFIENIYSMTGYVQSKELYKQPENLGVYSGGNTYVFQDAVTKDKTGERVPISDDQKDIIDAHEKTHAVYEILSNDIRKKLMEPFMDSLKGYKGKHQADEVLARMAQLKNYFGFSKNEVFTKKHLDYAKEHYINDVDMDNTMNDFLQKIENEKLFIENMNTIPC